MLCTGGRASVHKCVPIFCPATHSSLLRHTNCWQSASLKSLMCGSMHRYFNDQNKGAPKLVTVYSPLYIFFCIIFLHTLKLTEKNVPTKIYNFFPIIVLRNVLTCSYIVCTQKGTVMQVRNYFILLEGSWIRAFCAHTQHQLGDICSQQQDFSGLGAHFLSTVYGCPPSSLMYLFSSKK